MILTLSPKQLLSAHNYQMPVPAGFLRGERKAPKKQTVRQTSLLPPLHTLKKQLCINLTAMLRISKTTAKIPKSGAGTPLLKTD